MTNRRILLTGASSGIGQSLARLFAAQGTRLLLLARREKQLGDLAAELRTLGAASVEIVAGDITDAQVRQTAIDRIRQLWGKLDLLINNAGVSAHGRFVDTDEATVRQIMEVNFFATAELTRLAIPLLQESNDGLVVNIGSILGHRGIPHNSAYVASKFALRGWSEALRAELSRDNIGLLLVSPGTTDTEFFDHLLSSHGDSPWPKQRGISPDQVAKQIAQTICRRRREIFPNWRGRLLVTVNRFFPSLVDRFMNRYG